MALRSKTDRTDTTDKDVKTTATGASPKQGNFGWFMGWVVLAAGLFFTLAILSHFFDWKNDFSALHPGPFDSEKHIDNICGPVGARVADALTRGSFGVFGLLVPVIAVLLGFRIIRRRSMLFNHSTLSTTFVLILGSLTLGVALGTRWDIFGSGWGGAFGIFVADKMTGGIGLAGTIIVLVVGWIFTGVFININFIGTVDNSVETMVSGAETVWERLRRLFACKPKANPVDETSSLPAEHLTVRPVQMPETVSVPEPQDSAIPAEPEIEDDVVIREPTAENIIRPHITVGEVETINDWYRSRNLGGSADDAVEESEETDAETITFGGSIFEEFDADIEDEDVPSAETEPEPEFEDTGEESETDSAGGTHMPSNGIEEFDIDAESGSAESAGPAAAGGLGRIIVEEHREKQVSDGEIGSLYDPMKDIPNYRRPSGDMLEEHTSNSHVSDEEITFNKQRIEETLAHFGIPICDMKATVGPTVTLYEIVQKEGVKISRIQGLEDDIAQSLKALGIRIIAPMPGRGTIGIEVPNRDKEIVSMRSAVLSKRFQQFEGELPVVIGRTIQNENYVFDLAKMPHLLVAGATGQGKSVGLNAIITSLLYRKHPSQLKFVLIDPKMVEFSLYARLEKHFLAKMESEEEAIVTDPKKAVNTLQALCIEMGNRLELCKKAAARNIVEYNEKFVNRRLNPQNGHRYLPYIVVVVDEFADLIMMAKEVEAPVMRLAQKARAIGIHLIIATQRPDVKVITGGIKANFPARIAFRVMQMTDSRTIIDQPGANQLIGRGDMLFSKDGELTRIQCAFIDTPEVERIVDSIAGQQGYTSAYSLPDYEEAGASSDAGMGSSAGSDLGGGAVKYDALFADIARDAVQNGQISVSYIQRNYEVGFNRAGRIMSQLERAGIVGPQIGAKQRDIKFYDLPSLEAKLQDLGLS